VDLLSDVLVMLRQRPPFLVRQHSQWQDIDNMSGGGAEDPAVPPEISHVRLTRGQ
jgi:hypothetical protein